MIVGYDYPLLGFFWSVLIIFLWVAWIFLLFRVFADIFRNHEMGGFAKAVWCIFVIIVPFLGVLIYLIANGSGMSRRQAESVRASQEQFDSYVKSVSGGSASELAKAKELLDSGAINQAEYDQLKSKVLA